MQRDKQSLLWNSTQKATKPYLPLAAVKEDKIRGKEVAALERPTECCKFQLLGQEQLVVKHTINEDEIKLLQNKCFKSFL